MTSVAFTRQCLLSAQSAKKAFLNAKPLVSVRFSHQMKVREAIIAAQDEEIKRDDRVFLIGEEVAQFDGSHQCSRGLWKKWGDKRIVDTPIVEIGFTGLACGAAFVGLRPIVEYMTMNFSLQAIDHIINTAAKMFYMSAGKFNVPIVFRGPNGPADGVAAQHTQDFSAYYASVPGLKVVAPYSAEDAKGLLKSAIRDDNPVMVLEDEMLYNAKFDMSEDAMSENFTVQIGKAKIERHGTDVTIVAYSMAVKYALQAAAELEKSGISAEVINLRTLRPLDFDAIEKSVLKTHRLITVEHGWPTCNIGAEVCAQVAENDALFHQLDAPLYRITGADVPAPYAVSLEQFTLPHASDVVMAAKKACHIA